MYWALATFPVLPASSPSLPTRSLAHCPTAPPHGSAAVVLGSRWAQQVSPCPSVRWACRRRCWGSAFAGWPPARAPAPSRRQFPIKPVDQRGYVSGWISAPQAIGIIAGLVLVTVLGLSILGGYALMAALLIVLGLPFLLLVPDAVLPPGVVPPLSVRTLAEGMWIKPRRFPDSGWTLLSRILVNLGNAFGNRLLLYLLMYGLKAPDAEGSLIVLTLVYMLFVTVASLWLGRISDKLGRRRAFVFGASVLQAPAALILAFVPTMGGATVAAGLLGLGCGCFLSVDQALATEVLPDQLSRGKDLGIMNIALTGALAVAQVKGVR